MTGKALRSRGTSRYFDVLMRICGELDLRGEDIPPMLARWRTEVAGGRRRRPGRKPLPPYRHVKLDHVRRDLKIQLTIAVLARLGVPPQGSLLSGCRIVSEAMNLSEYSVERIWEQPFQDLIRKYSKAIAERTGLFELHTTEARASIRLRAIPSVSLRGHSSAAPVIRIVSHDDGLLETAGAPLKYGSVTCRAY